MMLFNNDSKVGKTNHHLSHHWAICMGTPMLSAAPRPGIGGVPIANPDGPPHKLPSLYPPNEGPLMPPWLVYDRKVLCFHAYFKESLHEVYQAPYQVRPVKILFYLEDGTIQVTERKRDNSGLPQGCIVSRQRIPRVAPCHNEFLNILDLNVNQAVTLFSRVYHITDCDLFTRHFLNRAGISVPDPIVAPEDPGLALRAKMNAGSFPKKPSVIVDTLGQFLKNDRKVLRFYAYWDDREAMFGDLRELILFYFLADDTIQINEKFPINSGRDAPTKFLARTKVPKNYEGVPTLGQLTQYTVLNVLGGGLLGGRYVPDPLDVGAKPIKYYTEQDLTIGAIINLFGRVVHLIDCDDFTREYYRIKYGLEDFTPIPMPPSMNNVCVSSNVDDRKLPVFNGWGTHEDSEGNCKKTIPTPPRVDFVKFMKNDKLCLRFGAKMVSSIRDYCDRIFIVSFYLSTDEISVYELGIRNSGFLPGEFFKRQKFVLPRTKWFTSERPKRYQVQQFYIGATIELRGFVFALVTADEFCLQHMMANPFQFPLSNVDTILGKIREALRPCYKEFVAKYLACVCTETNDMGQEMAVAPFDTVRNFLTDLLGDDITDHEIVCLTRHFASEQKIPGRRCRRETVRSIAHGELTRQLWDDLDRLKEHLYHLDPSQSGFMGRTCLRSCMLACRLPFTPVLIEDIFSVLKKNECGDIDVCDFLVFIDRLHCKSTPIMPMNSYVEVCPILPFSHLGRVVDWNCFMRKIGLEQELVNATE